MFGNLPALRKDHEIDVRGAGLAGWRGENREDRRVRVIEQNCADRREGPQVVFVGHVIAVPGDDVERRMAGFGQMEAAAPFYHETAGRFLLLEACDRGLEVAWVGEAIGTDRPARGQGESRAIILADISARRVALEPRLKLHPARNDGDIAWRDGEAAELGRNL